MVFVITFHAISNWGDVTKEDFAYPYEPKATELQEDLQEFMEQRVLVFFHEHPEVNAKSRKWYSGLDVVGWVEEDDEEEKDYDGI